MGTGTPTNPEEGKFSNNIPTPLYRTSNDLQIRASQWEARLLLTFQTSDLRPS